METSYFIKFNFCIHLNSLKCVCIYVNTENQDTDTDFLEFVCICSVRRQHLFLATARVRSEIRLFHGISAKHHNKAILIYVWNTVAGLDIIECLITHYSAFLSHTQVHWGAVWHRSEDSFWICLRLSIFLLSSITLSPPPPSSSPNRCRLVLIDEANALQERLVLSPHAAKGVSCVLTLESRS